MVQLGYTDKSHYKKALNAPKKKQMELSLFKYRGVHSLATMPNESAKNI